jgi:hypothetical protein
MLAELKSKFHLSIATRFDRSVDVTAHERLRLRLLFAVAVMKLFNFIGGAWDIQWHVEIGRDSLWIPPHLLVMFAFTTGLLVTLALIGYETLLASAGQAQPHSLRIGVFSGPPAAFGISFGYFFALLSAIFDELWHEIFGIDATLWSPPHLLIMLATVLVDFSLMLGIAASARRLKYGLNLKSPLFWGLVLTGAYAFESVNFQMGEAFIVGYRQGGAGLYGLFFPILVGAFLPLSMMALIQLARRYWIVLPALGLTLLLQYLATGISAAGFAILKPVSVIEEYVRLNPESTAAKAREFAQLLGYDGLIGFHQAWTMSLSILPLVLVSLLGFFPLARRRPLLAAPLFSVSMVIFSFIWFQQMPALKSYPITGMDLLLACGISGLVGLLTGSIGLKLARLVPEPSSDRSDPARG